MTSDGVLWLDQMLEWACGSYSEGNVDAKMWKEITFL